MVEDFLAARVRVSRDAPALIFEGRTWTYGDLDDRVAAICMRLDARGVLPGDRVGVYLPNRPLFVALVHALIRMGSVIVPLNLRWTPVELGGICTQAGLDWMICEIDPEAGLVPDERVIFAGELGGGDHPHATPSTAQAPQRTGIQQIAGAENTMAGRAAQSGTNMAPAPEFEDEPAVDWHSGRIDLAADWGVLFTSGTSGTPRGAQLSLANLHASAVASAFRLGTLPTDRWLLAMPLYHIGGLSIVIRCCLYGTAVVLHNGFDPERVLESLAQDGVTLVSLVPTMLQKLLDAAGVAGLPGAVRLVLLGGAKAGEDLVSEALGRGVPVALTYGLTEAASQVATALPELVRRNPESVGPALLGTRLRIASIHADQDGDWHAGPGSASPANGAGTSEPAENSATRGPDASSVPGTDLESRAWPPGGWRTGEAGPAEKTNEEHPVYPGPALPAGEIGEIWVSGPTVMRGYLGEPPVGEWLRTGDIGYLDAQGALTVLQRRTDLIVSGGENVYPAEIERVLEAHPGIAAACVVGLPDKTWGQVVAAAVVPAGEVPDPAEVDQFVRASLAGYKIPRRILIVDELPCTASGKVCRPDVVALFNEVSER